MTTSSVPLSQNQAPNPAPSPRVLVFALEFKLSFQVSDITLIFAAGQAEMTGTKR